MRYRLEMVMGRQRRSRMTISTKMTAGREPVQTTHSALMNEAGRLLASSERLRHGDRLATLACVAGAIAHELGTPLNVIGGRTSMLLSDENLSEGTKKQASIIAQQAVKMTSILRELVNFARRRPFQPSTVDLAVIVRSAIKLAKRSALERGIDIIVELDAEPHEVQGEFDRLWQVTMNLITNAIQAMPDGGTLRVTIRSESVPPADDPDGPTSEHACIVVKDTGTGIPTELHPQLFRPFFTTKGADEGVGLGLAVALGIARDHRGSIEAASKPGQGSSFTLRIPKGIANAE